MSIGKSRGTSPINVNDMLEKVEINRQIETEKSEVDKLLVEIYYCPLNHKWVSPTS